MSSSSRHPNPTSSNPHLAEQFTSLPSQGQVTHHDINAVQEALKKQSHSNSNTNASAVNQHVAQIRPELLQLPQMPPEQFLREYQRRLETLATRYNRLTGTRTSVSMDASAPFGYHLQNVPVATSSSSAQQQDPSSSDNKNEQQQQLKTTTLTPGLRSADVYQQQQLKSGGLSHSSAVSPLQQHHTHHYLTHQHANGGETTGGKTTTSSNSGADNTADKENMAFAAQWFATPPELGGEKCNTLSLMNSLAVTPQNPQSAIENAAYTKGDIT